MAAVFAEILPFFALIALGFAAVRTGIFNADAAAYLTKFVFFFALPAMLFRFAATLPVAELFNLRFGLAYLTACLSVYGLVTVVALLRGNGTAVAAVEAQTGIIGNVGFLGVPLLVGLLGPAAAGPVIFVLSIDLVVFGSLFVGLITASREGGLSLAALGRLGLSILRNPMVMGMALGLGWSLLGWPVTGPFDRFLSVLGSAATPGALFAIGASLAGNSAERPGAALWLSLAKLVLHPAAVAVCALWIFDVDPFAAGVMIAAAAMPVAGNIYIVAQHYNVAPLRASSAILISHIGAVVTVTAVLGWVVARLPG